VGILEPAPERGREALELPGSLGERAGKPSRDRVEQKHRRQVAVREDVRPHRELVRREVLHDALVEALEAGGQQRERRQGS
jgi:hypothetical protein